MYLRRWGALLLRGTTAATAAAAEPAIHRWGPAAAAGESQNGAAAHQGNAQMDRPSIAGCSR